MPAKKPARPLTAYDAKRDFTRSPEPRGDTATTQPTAAGLSFCVQKHLASHLHYDFRLEHRGVLISWAVPKGPSLNPADKRMAVHVEDHPLDYGGFEGVIPSGYGAGVVLLWDRGTWTPDAATADVDAALKKGELKFSVDGVKLKGSWVLVRTARQISGRPEQWLLIKHRDRWSGDVDVAEFGDSVKSFRGLSAILAANGTPTEWKTNPPVRGGETGRLFREVMDAAERTTGRTTVTETKAARKTKPTNVPRPDANRPPPDHTALSRTPTQTQAPRPKLTNRDKVLFSADRFTKGELVDYYTRIAPLMLPQLAGRAVTFHRFPDGVSGKSFFEKRCPDHRPPWVSTVHVAGEKAGDKSIDYCTIDSVAALQWAANLASIELHVPLALSATPDVPTAMIFDLDPGPPAALIDCVRIGLRLKAVLDGMKLESVPKTSGGKGLHVLVPLNTPGVTFADTKRFAKAVALTLQKDDPTHVIASMARSERTGRVFIDWGQNDRDKTNACVFSVRAREQPTVSWPVSWKDLAAGETPEPVSARDAKPNASLKRWLAKLTLRQTLPAGGR